MDMMAYRHRRGTDSLLSNTFIRVEGHAAVDSRRTDPSNDIDHLKTHVNSISEIFLFFSVTADLIKLGDTIEQSKDCCNAGGASL